MIGVVDVIFRFCSFWGGFNSVFSNILDLPIYPVLFAGYVGQIFPHLHSYWLIIFKFIALAFVMFFNIKGSVTVGLSNSPHSHLSYCCHVRIEVYRRIVSGVYLHHHISVHC